MNISHMLRGEDSAHWYDRDGKPCHQVEKRDGTGPRPTTLADARKHGWLPSVTTILKVLDKPGLNTWKTEQAILAALTSPRVDGEAEDAFVQRILSKDREHDEESQKARDLGTLVHAAIESACNGESVPAKLAQYVDPVMRVVEEFGRIVFTERIIVADDYAGCLDLGVIRDTFTLIDFKTCKKLPDVAWPEHRLQLAAYAAAVKMPGIEMMNVETMNIYISTTEPGKISVCPHDSWKDTFERGFKPLINIWQWLNNYTPPKHQTSKQAAQKQEPEAMDVVP